MARKSSEQALTLTFAPMKIVGHSIAEDEEAEVLEEGNVAFSVTGSSGCLRELGGQRCCAGLSPGVLLYHSADSKPRSGRTKLRGYIR